MKKTYTRIYIHCIFSTKKRKKLISPKIEKRLWKYIGGVAKRMEIEPVAIGGVEDHLHLLLSLPPNLSVSFIMQKLKSISSKWMNDTFYAKNRIFRWQIGYSAFSVGYSQKQMVTDYINTQRQKHKTLAYDEEHRLFLEKYQIKPVQNLSVKKELRNGS